MSNPFRLHRFYYPPETREIEEAKDRELYELAKKYGREHKKAFMYLPKNGVVKLVLEHCPSWIEYCKHGDGSPWDNRGIGISIGRRIKKLGIRRV